MGQSRPLFCLLFSFFFSLQFQYKFLKSVDGVHGIRTRGHMMVGADKTTELLVIALNRQEDKRTYIKIQYFK